MWKRNRSFRNQKDREIDLLFAVRQRFIVSSGLISNVKIPVEETLTVAHGNGLLFIDTEHLRDVLPIEMEIGYHPHFVQTLHRHDEYECYGGDFFHRRKVLSDQIIRYDLRHT